MSRLEKILQKWPETRLLSMKGVPDGKTTQDIIAAVTRADPTRNLKYTAWLLDAWARNTFAWEDIRTGARSTVGQALELFESKKRHLVNVDDRSLMRYQSPGEMWSAVQHLQEGMEDTHTSRQKKKITARKIALETWEHTFDSGLVFSVPMSQKAAIHLGRGTRWCTSADNDNAFNDYMLSGVLGIIRLPDGQKFQGHIGENDVIEFLNAADNHVTVQESNDLAPYVQDIHKAFEAISMGKWNIRNPSLIEELNPKLRPEQKDTEREENINSLEGAVMVEAQTYILTANTEEGIREFVARIISDYTLQTEPHVKMYSLASVDIRVPPENTSGVMTALERVYTKENVMKMEWRENRIYKHIMDSMDHNNCTEVVDWLLSSQVLDNRDKSNPILYTLSKSLCECVKRLKATGRANDVLKSRLNSYIIQDMLPCRDRIRPDKLSDVIFLPDNPEDTRRHDVRIAVPAFLGHHEWNKDLDGIVQAMTPLWDKTSGLSEEQHKYVGALDFMTCLTMNVDLKNIFQKHHPEWSPDIVLERAGKSDNPVFKAGCGRYIQHIIAIMSPKDSSIIKNESLRAYYEIFQMTLEENRSRIVNDDMREEHITNLRNALPCGHEEKELRLAKMLISEQFLRPNDEILSTIEKLQNFDKENILQLQEFHNEERIRIKRQLQNLVEELHIGDNETIQECYGIMDREWPYPLSRQRLTPFPAPAEDVN